jgi:hypothetical protein
VRDVKHAPLMRELKRADWWRPEYSRQATDAEAAAAAAAVAAAEAEVRSKGTYGGQDEAPERLLRPLHGLLRAIRLGKVNESNAASATIEQFEGLNFDEDEGAGEGRDAAGRTNTAALVSFESYFGCERPALSLDAFMRKEPSGGGGGGGGSADDAAAGAAAAAAVAPLAVPGGVTGGDGRLHLAEARLCSHRASSTEVVEKIMDLRVAFSKSFPLTPEQFLPVAEMMARTSEHAANFTSFFRTKFPRDAGFPVRFSIPVFPTVTATVTMEQMDTYRAPPKGFFEVPKDFKMGAYIERGFLRQL